MSFFKKKPHRIRIIRRQESDLRLRDWQMDGQLCSMASKLMARDDMKLVLAVLRNEHPLLTALPYGVSMDDRVVLQARAEGYQMALNNLDAMARNLTVMPMPDTVFEDDVKEA